MTTGLPSQTQVIELLDAEFARAGYEIEDVVIDARTRPPRITVIADGDDGLDLDTAATLSRSASALLDDLDTIGDHYVLEVSSRGVDRPDQREALPPRLRPQGRRHPLRRIDADRPHRRDERGRRRAGGSHRPRLGDPRNLAR